MVNISSNMGHLLNTQMCLRSLYIHAHKVQLQNIKSMPTSSEYSFTSFANLQFDRNQSIVLIWKKELETALSKRWSSLYQLTALD